MEQQQTQNRERQKTERPSRKEAERRTPERERLAGPGLTAQAVLEGAPLWELPPQRLEELAALVGNQGMAALLEGQSLPLEEVPFDLPPEAETAPYPVPDSGPVRTVQPPELAGETAGRAFDPAGLVYGGGEPHGAVL